MRDLVNIVPMRDPIIVLKVTGMLIYKKFYGNKFEVLFFIGEQIVKTLENSVSMYPKLEGRFPQVAGVNFAFDPNKPPGQRVDPAFIRIGDEYLNFDQTYRLATKSYLHSGCDGYTMLKNAEIVVSTKSQYYLNRNFYVAKFILAKRRCLPGTRFMYTEPFSSN